MGMRWGMGRFAPFGVRLGGGPLDGGPFGL
jgi:hypothetical protein